MPGPRRRTRSLRTLAHYLLRLGGGIFMLFACVIALNCQNGNYYFPSPYHRLQVDALLRGHFQLSNSIEQLELGLAWHNGAIQQVWGLGVPIWHLPFELAFRSLSRVTCPDIIPLGIALFLFGWYCSSTGFII